MLFHFLKLTYTKVFFVLKNYHINIFLHNLTKHVPPLIRIGGFPLIIFWGENQKSPHYFLGGKQKSPNYFLGAKPKFPLLFLHPPNYFLDRNRLKIKKSPNYFLGAKSKIPLLFFGGKTKNPLIIFWGENKNPLIIFWGENQKSPYFF